MSIAWNTNVSEFVYANNDYLIVADCYSRFFEIALLQNIKSSTVIGKTKAILARHGIPEEVKSDNGPQFTADEFAKFATDWDFKHTTVSPRYLQSNGLAEKSVQIAKNLPDKVKRNGRDPQLALTGAPKHANRLCGLTCTTLQGKKNKIDPTSYNKSFLQLKPFHFPN